ncbi:MAG: NAD(P)-dependent oxidoreductase [Candidatus Levybacteria bacterium]|nr:NAD(P)-dependent oxidoreductase [Candidatus Levybacteria bacterium]
MDKKRIAITGSRGTIGIILKDGLPEDFEIIEASLPEVDVRDFGQLKKVARGAFAIIHLAWNSKAENHKNEQIDPDSSLMFLNVYKAAIETGAKRVIMASSIHADTFIGRKGPPASQARALRAGPGLLSPDRTPVPDSPYGANKVFAESMGRYFASKGLEVVCVRFGGVNQRNSPAGAEHPAEERAAWLSHNDLISLIRAILQAESIPNFVLMYAVSDNPGRIHDTSNPFGWMPKDRA